MRTFANLLLVAVFSVVAVLATAQNGSPFGGESAAAKPQNAKPQNAKPQNAKPSGDNPFGDDPFGLDQVPKTDLNRSTAGSTTASRRVRKGSSKDTPETAEQIRAALDETTSQHFVETPLSEAVRQLSETHDIPILVDSRALMEIGMSKDDPVSLSLQNVSLRSFLRLMLRDLDLTYTVQDEVLQITTMQSAEQNLTIEMYTFPSQLSNQSKKLIEALTGSIVPDTWEQIGGPSSVHAIENVLIISTTENVHEEVREFLKKLEQTLAKS